ncbi:hypothetical protein M378DRAFT_19560 [Amanita muscaria Koide BX008]|uniref:Uncharacterized protein n=1 Tax=Amanita muscaria (strain Koide BX008) TaxID=946122 RepID=A0A0C2WB28_AMAMK|nr:hypothetical protein M378DRAFT_19560 [Amanita muscaria Koide BX008]
MTGKQAKVATEKPTIRIPIRRPSTKAKTGKGTASDSETAAAVKPKKTPKKKGRGKKVAETVESGSDEGEDDGDEVEYVLHPSYAISILTEPPQLEGHQFELVPYQCVGGERDHQTCPLPNAWREGCLECSRKA